MFTKITDKIFKVVQLLCSAMLCAEVLLVFITVICRNIFNFTPIWGESLTLFLLVWTSMISASLPIRTNGHISVTLIDYLIGKKGGEKLSYVVDAVCALYAAIICYAGIAMVGKVSNTILNGIKISKGYLFASVPAAMILMILAFAEKFALRIGNSKKEEKV